MIFRSILLWSVAGILAALILVNLGMSIVNQRRSERVSQLQLKVNEGRKKENILRQLTLRIAQGIEAEPQLRDILVRRELKASLVINGKTKEYP